jgi:hypothetical protein
MRATYRRLRIKPLSWASRTDTPLTPRPDARVGRGCDRTPMTELARGSGTWTPISPLFDVDLARLLQKYNNMSPRDIATPLGAMEVRLVGKPLQMPLSPRNKTSRGWFRPPAHVKLDRLPSQPSIPRSDQAWGYETDETGALVLMKPPQPAGALCGPGSYSPSLDTVLRRSPRIDFALGSGREPVVVPRPVVTQDAAPERIEISRHRQPMPNAVNALCRTRVARAARSPRELPPSPGPGAHAPYSGLGVRPVPAYPKQARHHVLSTLLPLPSPRRGTGLRPTTFHDTGSLSARAATLEKPSPRCWHNIPDFDFWGLNEGPPRAPPAAQIVIEPRLKAAAEQATPVPDLAPDLSPTPWPSTPSGDPRHGDRRGQGSMNLPNLE